MKTAIFVIGKARCGKTSIISALTGQSGHKHEWEVRSLDDRQIVAFVITSALQEDRITKEIPLNDEFLEKLEERYRIQREYELLICPLEIRVREGLHTFDEYLQFFIKIRFDVRVAIINNSWNNKPLDENLLSQVRDFISLNDLESVELDIFNSDEHLEANRLRQRLYPN